MATNLGANLGARPSWPHAEANAGGTPALPGTPGAGSARSVRQDLLADPSAEAVPCRNAGSPVAVAASASPHST